MQIFFLPSTMLATNPCVVSSDHIQSWRQARWAFTGEVTDSCLPWTRGAVLSDNRLYKPLTKGTLAMGLVTRREGEKPRTGGHLASLVTGFWGHSGMESPMQDGASMSVPTGAILPRMVSSPGTGSGCPARVPGFYLPEAGKSSAGYRVHRVLLGGDQRSAGRVP